MSAFVSFVFSVNILMGWTMGYRQMDPTIRLTNPDKADVYDTYERGHERSESPP